jgi:hypothetical protein
MRNMIWIWFVEAFLLLVTGCGSSSITSVTATCSPSMIDSAQTSNSSALMMGTAQSWTPVQNVPNIGAGAIALLTDGRVLVHDENSMYPQNWGNWWTLTPDMNGNYATGTWARVATLPSGYGPLHFAAAVLPDGRYIIEGGEDNLGVKDAKTTLGAIYDPVTDHWTAVKPPYRWGTIGDSPSVILADGTYMQTSCCDRPPKAALLDASTLTWTTTGARKFDLYDEEGLTLLPGGMVLDIDAYVGRDDDLNGKNWEIFDPATGTWSTQGSTPEQYWDSAPDLPGGRISHELGPAVLMPNGTVLQTGANGYAAGHNGIYNVVSNSWTEAPDFPGDLDIADGPGALERNGNVLLMTSPGIFQGPPVFLEWNGSSFNPVPGPLSAANDSSDLGQFLMLPTGQIMFTDRSNDVELFNSAGSDYTGWNPEVQISRLPFCCREEELDSQVEAVGRLSSPRDLCQMRPATVFTRGRTYTLEGFKFNGASQNNAYGDDFQDPTNYPLVRLTNVSSGHVFYARTHDHSTMAVGYTGATSTRVDIPANMETGVTKMQVVVNGIASQKYTIAIR